MSYLTIRDCQLRSLPFEEAYVGSVYKHLGGKGEQIKTQSLTWTAN